MADEIVSTGIKIETGDVERAVQSLDKLAAQGPKVEQSLDKVEQTSKRIGKSLATLGGGTNTGLDAVGKSSSGAADQMGKLDSAAKKSQASLNASAATADAVAAAIASVSSSSRSAIASQESLAAAVSKFTTAEREYIQRLVDEAKQIGMTRAERERYIAQTRGMSEGAQQVAAAVGAKIDAYKSESRELSKLSTASSEASQSMLGMVKTGVVAFLGSQVVSAASDASKALYAASAAGERLRTMLDFSASGNSAREIEYLRSVTDRLGLQFTTTAVAYGQFAAAAKGTALEGKKARDVFESIASASAVMGLSTDQTTGVLLALQQMLSKGTVQAEELRGQLGERLPGAFQIAAKAMGVTTAELGKMLEQGQVISDDFLPKFAKALNDSLGGAAEKAAQRLDAAVNRFDNAWERLKQRIGDSGVSKALQNELNALTDDITVFGETMDKIGKSGGGVVSQIVGAGAAEAGRLAFATLNTSANLLNGTINTLTGNFAGFLKLRTDLALLPDFLRTDAQQAAVMAQNLADAEREFERMKAQGAASSENVYLRSEYAQLAKYIEQLKEAQRERAKLTGGSDPRDQSGFTSRGQSADAEAKRLESVQAAMQKVLAGVSGVKESFQKDLTALYAGYQSGLIKLADYQAAVAKLINESGGGKANAKAINEANKELAGQAKLLAELSGLSSDFSEDWGTLNQLYKQGKLNVDQLTQAQAKLLEKQPFMRDIAKEQAEAEKARAKAYDEVVKSYEKHVDQLQKSASSAADQVQKLQDEEKAAMLAAAGNLSLAQAIQEVTIARLREQQTKEAQAGNQEAVDAIEKEIKARRELIGLIGNKDSRDAATKAAKDAAEAWRKTADKIEDAITDSLMRGFESGKGFAENLRDTVENMFKTLVLRPVVKAAVEPVAQSITNSLGLSSSSGSSSSSMLAGFSQSTIGSLFGYADAANSASDGKYGEALGTAIGTAYGGPVGAMIGKAVGAFADELFRGDAGTPHTGGSSSYSAASGLTVGMGVQGVGSKAGYYSTNAEDVTTSLVQSVVSMLDSTATTFGKEAGYAAAAGFADDTSKDGAWGSLLIEQMGKAVVNWDANRATANTPRLFSDGEAGSAEYLAAVAADVRSTLEAIGLPGWATGMLDKLGDAPTIEQLASVVSTINATQSALVSLGDVMPQLSGLTDSAVESLLASFGSIDQLSASAQSYYEAYYTDAERAAKTTQQVGEALDKLGLSMPATREAYRALVEAQDLTTESGQKTYAALLQLSPAFASVIAETTTLADTAAAAAQTMAEAGRKALASLAEDQGSLIVELLSAQGKTGESAALARQQAIANITDGLSETDAAAAIAAYDYNQALRAQIDALTAATSAQEEAAAAAKTAADEAIATAKARAEATANEAYSLTTRLLTAQGDTAALRERELAALDPSNRALLEQIYALEDQKAAAEAAAQAATQAAQAAEALTSAWQSVTDSLYDEVARIRGLVQQDSGASYASVAARFGITTGQARAGDQEAAKLLPSLSQTMLTLAEAQATSLVELQRIRAQTAASLESTGSILASQFGLTIPKLDTGTNFVPRDMLAVIHKGEAVVPAAYNPGNGGGSNNSELLAEIRGQREETRVQALRLVQLQNEMNKRFKDWDSNGLPNARNETA